MPLYPLTSSSTWVAKNSNYTANADDQLLIDTSGGGWTLKLPSNPAIGTTVEIIGANGLTSNKLSIDRNSNLINGQSPQIIGLKQNFQNIKFIYSGNTVGWLASGNVLSLSNQYPAEILTDSPWAYYRLGESSGTVANDSSGNNRNGIYVGGLTLGQSSSLSYDTNTCCLFNGSSGYVQVPFSSINPNPFSLECRFKTTASNGSLFGFSNLQTTGGSNFDRELRIINGQLNFMIYAGGNVSLTSPSTYNDGNWHTVTALVGASGMQLWVDGTIVALNTVTNPQSYTGYWHIGYSTGGNYFNGLIDEVSITLSALSSNRIQARYAAASA